MIEVSAPETLRLVSQKASAILGFPVVAVAIDSNSRPSSSKAMQGLLDFGRNHSGIVNIKE